MSPRNVNETIWCDYCKEEINYKDGYVFKNNKYYHLACYHILIDCPLEALDDDEEAEDYTN
jgi:hypothetical protein